MKPNRKKYTSYVREITTKFKTLNTERIHLSSPHAVAEFLTGKIGEETKENFVVLGVDNKNMVMMYNVVSVGTISEAVVHPREVFYPALMTACSGIIVAHNHPSGNFNPSKQDLDTTKRLVEAGKVLGVPLLDHIIITVSGQYYSIKENGGM